MTEDARGDFPEPRLDVDVFLLWASTLCILLPTLLLGLVGDQASASLLLALVNVWISGSRYAWLIGIGDQRPYELMFWLFSYVFMSVSPLVQIAGRTSPSTTPGTIGLVDTTALSLVAIGMLSALLGCISRGARTRSTKLRVRATGTRPAGTMALAAVATTVSLYFLSKVGLEALFGSRQSLSRVVGSIWTDRTIAAVVLAFSTMPLVVAFVALVRLRAQVVYRRTVTCIAVCIGGLLLLVVNPISSPRYIFGTVALSMLAAIGALNSRRRFRVVAVSAVAALIAIFPVADFSRYADGVDRSRSNGVVSGLTTGDFDAYAQLVNAILYVDSEGLTYGRQGLGVILFWVPRVIWPGKPSDTGVVLAEFRSYHFTNLSAPIWAELYINGGLILVASGLFVLGRILRRLDDAVCWHSTHLARQPLLSGILPYYSIMLYRGSLLQAMAYLTVLILSVSLVSHKEPCRVSPRSGQRTGNRIPSKSFLVSSDFRNRS